jgi:TolA-binding protein
MTQDPNSIPEAQGPDWIVLRDAVKEYESSRADIEQRSLVVVQGKFRALTDKHSHDRIGDEALYYIGRIYYDMRDYHDARITFIRHREFFPDSDFAGTITLLEKEMDRDSERYRQWLEESRAASSVVR